MSAKTKGVYWSDGEIEAMLRALHSIGAGRKVMTSTNIETTTLFHEVSVLLANQGYTRTVAQIRAKFKKEKGIFYEAMEQHGGLPPREDWGPRFGLLEQLWVQGDRPDFRLRRPAASGKPKRHRTDDSSRSADEESSSAGDESRAVPSTSPATFDIGEGTNVGVLGPTESITTSNTRRRKTVTCVMPRESMPSYEELAQEVWNNRLEIARLKRTCEFLRQGIQRLSTDKERKRMQYAIQKQKEEDYESIVEISEEEEEEVVVLGKEVEGQALVGEELVALDLEECPVALEKGEKHKDLQSEKEVVVLDEYVDSDRVLEQGQREDLGNMSNDQAEKETVPESNQFTDRP